MKKILLQLDADLQPSAFDSVVAIDAGVDHLLTYGGVTPEQARDLVHGAIFTRGPDALRNTAIFLGGSDAAAAEKLLHTVTKTFFGPMRVSVLLDPNGANTTAAAAVHAVSNHLQLASATVLVLAATGPVGQRAVRMLAEAGAEVRVASRALDKAQAVVASTTELVKSARLTAFATGEDAGLRDALDGAQAVIAAGAPGAMLLPASVRNAAKSLQVAIDLNAVPPLGIEGIKPGDKAADRDGQIAYGAIGVGGFKMKLHKRAIAQLFTANDLVLDAPQLFALAQSNLEAS